MTLELWLIFAANIWIVLSFFYFLIFFYFRREHSEETKRRPRSFVSNALFREFWYFFMEPLKKKLIRWGVHPNTITLWGLIFSIIAGILFGMGKFGLGGWMVILASTCDVYDGLIARARKLTLKSGSFFDSTLDRVGETAMFFGLLYYFRNDTLWFVVIFVVVAASGLVSYCRARAEGLGFDKGGSRGFFQRAERMIVLSIGMGLVPVAGLFFQEIYVVYFTTLFIAVGSVQTAISRSVGIYREIKSTEPPIV